MDQFNYSLLSANYVSDMILIYIMSLNPTITWWGSETILHPSHLKISSIFVHICFIVIIILIIIHNYLIMNLFHILFSY